MIKLEHRSIELLWTLSLMLLFGIMLKLGDLTVDTGNCAPQDWVCQIGFLFLPAAQIVALMGVIVPIMKAGGKYWNVIRMSVLVFVASTICLLHKHLRPSPQKCEGAMFHLNETYCEFGGILSLVVFLTTAAGLFFVWLLRREVFLGGRY